MAIEWLLDDLGTLLPPEVIQFSAMGRGEQRQSHTVGCTLAAWKTHRDATSQITRGQDRHDARTAGNRFQAIREYTVDRSRIVEARCNGLGSADNILNSTIQFDKAEVEMA